MPMLAASWAYVLPNEFSAIANPPDAEPVMPPITLAATAIDTSGPPGTARNPSRTTANAGNAATTAPKPTKLAVLSTGSTEALAPASRVLRNSGRRLRWITARISDAIASAVTTDQAPLTAESEVSPNRGSARNPVYTRGSTNKLMRRLTTRTIRIGATDSAKDGNSLLRWPCGSSAGSKLSAFAARSRTNCSSVVTGVSVL